MNRGLVHFVASDAHDCDRPPRLDLAFAHVSRRWGTETAEGLFVRNPAAALTGDPLPRQAASGQPGNPGRKWYRFWS
jgi:tyrosine-protein phosphatase YwqE